MISRELLEFLFTGIDWETIRRQSALPTEYNGYQSKALIASHALPYLLPLPSERSLARELLENEFLQQLCGFRANVRREEPAPTRATLWHFRASQYGSFQRALIRSLVALFVKSRDASFDLPFVSFLERVADGDLGFSDSFALETPALTADVIALVPPSREPRSPVLQIPAGSQLNLDLLRSGNPDKWQLSDLDREHFTLPRSQLWIPRDKLGIADHVGLPAIVQVETPQRASTRMWFEPPEWLYTGLRDRDRLVALGPSYESKPYTACNILVLRIIDNKPHILLAPRLVGTGAGQFAIPGGKCKPGERIEECAKRELLEETGLIMKTAAPISCHRRRGSQRGPLVTSVGVLAEEYEGEPVRKEPQHHGDWRWVPLNGLPDNLFVPARLVVDAFNQRSRLFFTWNEIEDAASLEQLSLFEPSVGEES